METIEFKTDIKCSGCIAKVTPDLNETVGEGNWEVDLNSPLRVLTITSNVKDEVVKEALKKVGYRADKI